MTKQLYTDSNTVDPKYKFNFSESVNTTKLRKNLVSDYVERKIIKGSIMNRLGTGIISKHGVNALLDNADACVDYLKRNSSQGEAVPPSDGTIIRLDDNPSSKTYGKFLKFKYKVEVDYSDAEVHDINYLSWHHPDKSINFNPSIVYKFAKTMKDVSDFSYTAENTINKVCGIGSRKCANLITIVQEILYNDSSSSYSYGRNKNIIEKGPIIKSTITYNNRANSWSRKEDIVCTKFDVCDGILFISKSDVEKKYHEHMRMVCESLNKAIRNNYSVNIDNHNRKDGYAKGDSGWLYNYKLSFKTDGLKTFRKNRYNKPSLEMDAIEYVSRCHAVRNLINVCKGYETSRANALSIYNGIKTTLDTPNSRTHLINQLLLVSDYAELVQTDKWCTDMVEKYMKYRPSNNSCHSDILNSYGEKFIDENYMCLTSTSGLEWTKDRKQVMQKTFDDILNSYIITDDVNGDFENDVYNAFDVLVANGCLDNHPSDIIQRADNIITFLKEHENVMYRKAKQKHLTAVRENPAFYTNEENDIYYHNKSILECWDMANKIINN